MNFTDENLFGLGTERSQQEFFDSSWRGHGSFGVRVNRGRGDKVFFLMYSFQGKRRRYPLGRFPTVSLDDARTLASRIVERVQNGEDPTRLRKLSRKEGKLESLSERYLGSKALSQKTVEEYRRLLSQEILPYFRGRDAEGISERELRRLLFRIGEERGAPALSNRVRSLLHALFQFGIDAGLSSRNPLEHLKPSFKEGAKRKSRIQHLVPFETIQQTYLSAAELGGASGALVQFALLSGVSARRIRELRWSDIRGDFWNSGSALIHLTPVHRQILELSRNNSEFIFSPDGKRPFQNTRSLLLRVQRHTAEELSPNWSELERSIRQAMLKAGLPFTELSLAFSELQPRTLSAPEPSLVEWASRRIFTEWAQLLSSSGPEERGKVVRLRRLTRLK